jgi:catechol 2,3-dioxygenase-like lactoylglutathione lyase family enzyme
MKARWMIPLVVVLVLFSNSLACYAQTQQVNGIAHIALRVSDLDSSRNFFHRLGFEESFSLTSGGKAKEVFVKINDHQFIELYPRADATQTLGWMHVCYESDSLDDLNSAFAVRGLKPSPVVKGGAGNLIFSLKDPEGRVVEFTQYLPGSLHFVDRGKHLGEHRISKELIGIRIAVPDVAAAEKFYKAGLGFDEEALKSGLRMQLSSETHQWIELDPAKANRETEFWLRVPNAHRARSQALALGLAVKRQRQIAFIDDPDGNIFALAEDRWKSDGHP